MSNLEKSRDYRVEDYTACEDQRLRDASRDAKFVQASCFLYCLIEFILAYTLCPKDVTQMTYILGIPAWTFICVAVSFLYCIGQIVYLQKFSSNVSLAARDGGVKKEA